MKRERDQEDGGRIDARGPARAQGAWSVGSGAMRPAHGRGRIAVAGCALLALAAAMSCQSKPAKPTIGVAFETLQTEFWVAAIDAVRADLAGRGYVMVEAIADGDANRQLEQVRTFVARRVDGIVVVPKDAKGVIPAIRGANEAGIPIVLFNRPADPSDAKSVAIVADNLGIARATVDHLCSLARQSGRKQKAAILIGDLGDVNSIGRRDGFDQAAAACADAMEVVA